MRPIGPLPKYIITRTMLIVFGVVLGMGVGSINLVFNAMSDPFVVCIDNRANLTVMEIDTMLSVAKRETLRIFNKRVEFGCGAHSLKASIVSSEDIYTTRMVGIRSAEGNGAYNDFENWIVVFPYTKTNITGGYLDFNGGLLTHEIGHAIGYPHRNKEESIMHPKGTCILFNVSNCEREERYVTDPITFHLSKTLARGR